jgi:hypothetical protein
MPRLRPNRLAALLAAVLLAATAASARADDAAPPAIFGGHGVTFSYPLAWQHIQGQFQIQMGSALWTEFFAPMPAPAAAPDPTQPAPATAAPTNPLTDVVAVAAYKLPISITKKTLPKFKRSIQLAIMQLASRAGGEMTTLGTRTTMGGFPGYRFELSFPSTGGSKIDSRLVMVFKGKVEYFLNCQHTKDGPLAAEVQSGCDQVAQSFRAAR